jgi:hypothetical protein
MASYKTIVVIVLLGMHPREAENSRPHKTGAGLLLTVRN